MNTHLILFFSIFLTTNAFAHKKSASDINWNTEDESGCFGNFCIKAEQSDWPAMNERTDKADRMRRTDPFAEHNSDDGNDKKNAGVTFKID